MGKRKRNGIVGFPVSNQMVGSYHLDDENWFEGLKELREAREKKQKSFDKSLYAVNKKSKKKKKRKLNKNLPGDASQPENAENVEFEEIVPTKQHDYQTNGVPLVSQKGKKFGATNSLSNSLQSRSNYDYENGIKTVNFDNSYYKQNKSVIVSEVKLDRKTILSQRQSLPIYDIKFELLETLAKSCTNIIMGETGSGKTTQIPQFLHEENYDKEGAICIAQPRRVAAITIAKRVAEEMNCKIGTLVGYSVRFEEMCSKNTKIKFVTDGMLLREVLQNPLLLKYKYILLDEAHERTVNTDVLFGILKSIQKKRKLKEKLPLHLIIMSATMDVSNFKSYFNAPALYVEGRQHQINIQHVKINKPITDYISACLTFMVKVHREAKEQEDILIFLTGQEEIDFAIRLIENFKKFEEFPSYPILKAFPLYAALPYQKQLQVFSKTPPGERKVIVSTNIAETSVTIPGIKYVIDSGRVKVRTYNSRSGFDELKVCKISQSQSMQRAGRAGRECPGVCYRIYTNQEFVDMPFNTDPEILRTNLCSTVLKLFAMKIKDVINFDFMDKPKVENLQLALDQLKSLKAIEEVNGAPVLTELGRKMSVFPLEPRYAKLLINGPTYSCTEEILTIVAMLSTDSVLVTPTNKREEAEEKRKKFFSVEGDHIILLNIYKGFMECTNKQKWCHRSFVNYRNLCYAENVRQQLKEICVRNNIPLMSCNGKTGLVLRCLISGLFRNVAEKVTDKNYIVLHTREEVKIHPSSSMFRLSEDYVLFTELVKTEKTYMHINSSIRAQWLMEYDSEYFTSKHIKKTKSEPKTYIF
ncbi:UNVERIFIED_CONTAM: hypothetical protein RMT77_013110 [Armadillidium vulgare]